MALYPKCSKCGGELETSGALAFSPPIENKVEKYHICKKCWELFLVWLLAERRW